jgi:hypothetical protein
MRFDPLDDVTASAEIGQLDHLDDRGGFQPGEKIDDGVRILLTYCIFIRENYDFLASNRLPICLVGRLRAHLAYV